jgi:hypothetical protein
VYAAYVLVLVLGLRKGEVIGLPWAAVDLEAAELDITWQLQRVRGQLLHRETRTEASDAAAPPGHLRYRANAAAGCSGQGSGRRGYRVD